MTFPAPRRLPGFSLRLTRTGFAAVGSKRKVISVVKELEKEGLTREQLSRIYAPMGLEIGAISPEEIAISVAAEMIAVRRGPQSNWRALSMSIFADESLRALVK